MPRFDQDQSPSLNPHLNCANREAFQAQHTTTENKTIAHVNPSGGGYEAQLGGPLWLTLGPTPRLLQPLARPPGSTLRPVMQHPSHGAATVVAGRTCRTSLSIWYAHERFHSQQRRSTNRPAVHGPVEDLQIELFGLRWLWLRWMWLRRPIDGYISQYGTPCTRTVMTRRPAAC
jgi:hypothetical protein